MNFETIVTVVLLLLYLAAQVLGSRKSAPPGRRPGPTGDTSGPEPVEGASGDARDAMREIERLLRGESAPAPSAPAPSAPQQPVPAEPSAPRKNIPHREIPTRSVPQRSIPRREVPAAHKPTRLSGQPKRDLGAQKRFESIPASRGAASTPVIPMRSVGPPGRPLAPAVEAPEGRPNPLVDRLRDPKTAREVFLLSEVLGPPRSRR